MQFVGVVVLYNHDLNKYLYLSVLFVLNNANDLPDENTNDIMILLDIIKNEESIPGQLPHPEGCSL